MPVSYTHLENDAWLSLVERYVRDVEVAGSNPVTPSPWQGQGRKLSEFPVFSFYPCLSCLLYTSSALQAEGHRFEPYRFHYGEIAQLARACGSYPVSYTHLDVYKRQHLFDAISHMADINIPDTF